MQAIMQREEDSTILVWWLWVLVSDLWSLRSKWYAHVHIDDRYMLIIFKTYTLGRHCCLWCLIQQDQLIYSPSTRGAIAFRTVESIVEDNKKFVNAGADLRKAKLFNNCINKPFFKTFPLTQVAYNNYYTWQCEFTSIILTGVPTRPPHHSRNLFAPVCPPWECLSWARLDSSHAGDRRLWAELSEVCCSSWTSNRAKGWTVSTQEHQTATGAATHTWAGNRSSYGLNPPASTGVTRPAGNQNTLATTCKYFTELTHTSISFMCTFTAHWDSPARRYP